MLTEPMTCPTCGGNDSSRADGDGLHTCVYCGVRYRSSGGLLTALARAMPIANRRVLMAVAIGAAITVIGGLVLMTASREGTTPNRSPAGPVAPVTVSNTPSVPLPHDGQPPNSASGKPSVTVSNTPSVPLPHEVAATLAPPVAAPSARFELHHRRPSSGTTFFAIGLVINESPYVIDTPKITAVLKDEAGAEVGTAFGYANDVIGAGATEAAQVLVMNPPAFANIEFEIDARKATYIPAKVEGLRVEPGPVERAEYGRRFKVHGRVVHGGSVPARFIRVSVFALDGDGKVLGMDFTYANVETLQPGASSRFDLSMQQYSEQPAKWEFTVAASPVK